MVSLLLAETNIKYAAFATSERCMMAMFSGTLAECRMHQLTGQLSYSCDSLRAI